MLQRLQLQEMEENDEQLEQERVERLESLYKQLQMDKHKTDNVWFSLSEHERQEFWKLMETGELAAMTIQEENLHPWYCDSISNGLVEELSEEESKKEKKLPCIIPENIPPIESLVPSGNPSNLLKNNFIEIVFVYCFCYRLFVGDWVGELQVDVIECILRLSRVLNPVSSSSNPFQAFSSVKETIQSVMTLSTLPPFTNTKSFSVEVLNDVTMVVSFKNRSLLLLAHLHEYFATILKQQRGNTASAKRLKRIANKIWFYLSWCNSQKDSLFTELKEQVTALHQKYFLLNLDTHSTKLTPPSILSTPTRLVKLSNTPKEKQTQMPPAKSKKLIVEL